MSKFELYLLIFLIVFDVAEFVFLPLYYARKWKQTYIETCKEIYGAMFAGVPDAFRSFLKWCTTLPALLKKVVARWYAPFCRWLEDYRRQHRDRFQWGYDLACEFRRLLADYCYNLFEPYVNAFSGVPGVIQIQYITQKAPTDEEVQECMEHIVSKVLHYMRSYSVSFPIFPYYMIEGTTVSIFILYCEYAQEQPDFYRTINTIIMTKTAGSFGTLKECNVPKHNSDELILGYSASKWNDGGIVSPFVWSCKKDPNLIVCGVVGGGKSVCAQLLVRQLLSQKKDAYILDFKGGGDWSEIFKSDRYAEYLDCYSLFDKLYQEYLETIEKKEYRERYILIDEYNSMALNLEGKEQKEFFKKLSHLVYTGRSWGVKMILVGQSFSHEALPVSVRSQCNTRIYLANRISQQDRQMLFPGLSEDIDLGKKLNNYNGYITAPNTDFDEIVIPELQSTKQLKLDLIALGQQYYT